LDTEVVSGKDCIIRCLLGASPGASTATHVMLSVLDKAFPELTNSEKGKQLLEEMVPMWKNELTKDLFE
jgi:malate dehydrogenase (quinone)